MAEQRRVSALAGHYKTGRFEVDGGCGVTLTEVPDLCLFQMAAWPDTLKMVEKLAAEQVASHEQAALLRVEPLKWWLVNCPAAELTAEQGATLDLSHSRTQIRVSGERAVDLLNRHLPLDLREPVFPAGSVAATAFHHVGVTLWRSEAGYELFLPRGFALSLWELLYESAVQFGVEVV
jgi:heterotetrameric sarcosine oxidase gamma subunit